MNSGVSKARTRCFRVKISKAARGKLLDAVASTGAGMHIDNALVSGEKEDMLTRQVQSFHRATEIGLQ